MMLDELSIVHAFEEDHITETYVTDERDDFADSYERPTRSVTSAPTRPPSLTRAGGDTVNRSILNCATPYPIEGILCDLDIVPGAIFPDYELSDHTAKRRKLSELQGQHPMVLVLSRGGYCPKDRRQQKAMRAIPRGEGKSTGARPQRLTRIRVAREGIR
jgi:hypothetical protein